MNARWPVKLIVGAIFLGLLAVPLVIDVIDSGTSSRTSTSSDRNTPPEKRYGFSLEDVTEEAGISFKHQLPEFDEKLDHIMPQVAELGASVSVADVNDDGWSDLYLTNSARGTSNALYLNQGDGTFENVAREYGVARLNSVETGTSMGSVWGDYDNDGYEDLFVYKWGTPVLFHNNGGEGFERVSDDTIELPDWANLNTAVWFDYNRDGHLDLYTGGYYDEDVNLWDLETTRVMPDSYEYATNGGRSYLFRNDGDGTFTEVSEKVGVQSNRWTLAAGAADLNQDDYPELFVANDYGLDELYLNRGGERFEEVGGAANIGKTPKSGMNVAFGDVLNRGSLAVYVTNITEPGVLMQGNNLWVPSGDHEPGGVPAFRNLARSMNVEMGGWAYGAQFGDFNNDGWLDLYQAAGYVSGRKGTNYWYDFTMIAGGNSEIIQDARFWPPMDGRSFSGYQSNRVWVNTGRGQFREVSGAVGGGLRLDGRAVAVADLKNRGMLDVIVASQGQRVKLLENRVTHDHHWIAFELEGTTSNTSAIGANVTVRWNDRKRTTVITGGEGFSAQNQRRAHFGLGDASSVEKVVIQWPSGTKQVLESPDVDKIHRIREPE